jgi:hypothetical protein
MIKQLILFGSLSGALAFGTAACSSSNDSSGAPAKSSSGGSSGLSSSGSSSGEGSSSSSSGGSSGGSSSSGGADAGSVYDASTSPGICTETTGEEVTFKLKNDRNEPIVLWWLRPGARPGTSCDEVDYGVIGAQSSVDQRTYVGHTWAVRSERTGALLKAMTITRNETINIP